MPDPSGFPGYLPEGLWGEEYRDAGGTTVPDFLRQQQEENARRMQAYEEAQAAYAQQQQDASAADQQARYAQADAQFVDWPTFQKVTEGTEPGRQYDGYLGALEQQLTAMGYSPEDAQAEVQQFQRMVPRPAEDKGLFGNAWDSITSGFRSGTRASQAFNALGENADIDTIARMVVEQSTDPGGNASLDRFSKAYADQPGDDPTSYLQAIQRAWGATTGEGGGVGGLVNWLMMQAAQSYPSYAAALAGGVGGTEVGGPVGGLIGAGIGRGAGSLAVDTGSTLLELITQAAQDHGVDPRDQQAVAAMLQDSNVLNEMRQGAVAHGIPVAIFDAISEPLSLGVGGVGLKLAKGGRKLAGGATIASGGAIGSLGGAAGERLGQQAQYGELHSAGDVVAEALGDLVPGAASSVVGAAYTRARGLRNAQPTPQPSPTDIIFGDLNEDDLPGSGTPPGPPPTLTGGVVPNNNPTLAVGPEGGAFVPTPENVAARDRNLGQGGIDVSHPTVEEINIPDVPHENIDVGVPPGFPPDTEVGHPTVEEITLLPKQAVDTAEDRIREGRLLTLNSNTANIGPQVVTPSGFVASPKYLEDSRVADLTKPQPVDLNVKDPENVASWLQDRGVTLTPTQHAIVEDLAGTPPTQRRNYIASVIDELAASTDSNAEDLAHGLLAIAQTLPKDRAQAAQLAAAVQDLGIPPAQVPAAVSSALVQDVVAALAAGVTNEPATAKSASRVASTLASQSDTPVVVKRGLRTGERPPVPSLSALAHQLAGEPASRGPSEAGGSGAPAQTRSRSGLRAGVRQAPTAQPVAGRSSQGTRGNPLGNRTVTNDTSGTPGSPRLVVGTAYGSQLDDVANKEALQQQRDDARAKKQTKGLKKGKAAERARAIDAVVMTKEEYEKTYPGRNHDDDIQGIVSADQASGTKTDTGTPVGTRVPNDRLIELQHMSATEILNWIASVAPNPLMRVVARELAAQNLPTIFRLRHNFGAAGRYIQQVVTNTQTGKNRVNVDAVLIDPHTAHGPLLETILHEFVHAATLNNYEHPTTEEHRKAAARMDALYEYTKQQLEGEFDAYGLTNTKEFIAEGLSNPQFQNLLNGIMLPFEMREKISAWTAFKQLVMNLVGRVVKPDSVLQNVLTGVEGLIGADRGMGLNISADAAPVKAPSTAYVGAKNGVRSFIAYEKNGSFTLYHTDAANPRGIPSTKVPNLTPAQVEQYMQAQGADVIPPAGNTRATPGVPKNTATKLVGFDPNGDLRAAAFQQKDGTWTFYQSDADVRTDPDAKVSKGLTQPQVARYIAQAGLLNTAPTAAAVSPNAASPTAIGYTPSTDFRYNLQDTQAPLKAIGTGQAKAGMQPSENVGVAANLRNSNAQRAYQQAVRQYVEPAKTAGKQIMQQWGKTQADIEDTMQQLHIVERMQKKIQQTLRGSDDPVTQARRVRDLQAKLSAAQAKVTAVQNSNPGYLRAVQQEFAPKMKALTDAITDMAAQYGRISRDVAEQIKFAYDYYVPLQTGDKTTSGRAATGANVDTDKSFARVVEQLHRTINQGETNRVVAAVGNLIRTQGVVNDKNGQPVATVGPTTKVRYDPDTNSLSEQVDNHTFDPNSVTYYENGERHTINVTGDPVLLKALSPYKGSERNEVLAGIMAVSSWLNRAIAVGKTSLSPAFAPRNFFRDIQTANINLPPGVSRVKFNVQLANPKTYAEVATNVALELAGKQPTGQYAQARDAGAFISHRDYVNLGVIANDLDAIFKPTSSLKGLKAVGKRSATKTFEALSLFSQFSESVPRFAMYKAAYDSAIENGLAPKEARLFAANAAKTASVNFEQRGAYNLSSWWIFGNAKAQGLTALGDSIKRMGVTKAALAGTGLVGLGLLAAAMQYGYSDKDKDGKSKATKVPNYKKDNLVFFKEGAFGVPISQEISPLYILGHALGEYAQGGVSGTETASRIFTSILNNTWPGNVPQQEVAGYKASVPGFALRSVLPSSLLPAVDLYSNENTFGSQVVNNKAERLKRGIPLSEMGSANENELAVNAAKGLYKATNGGIDVAPQQLKLVHNYFDPLTEEYAFARDFLGLREEKYKGDVVNPIARGFTAQATGFYDQDQFDELLAKSTRAKYLAEQNGIASLSPEDQALAKSAGMLAKVQSDANSLFKGGTKLMTKDRRDLLNDRKQEMILDGIRRYNELRDRTVPKR